MAMDTIIKVFDHFSDAERARRELLASGFGLPYLHLRVCQTEAGADDGHFGTGDTGTVTDFIDGIFNLLSGGKAHKVDPGHHQTAQRGIYQMSVDVADKAQLARASSIMKQFGGADRSFL